MSEKSYPDKPKSVVVVVLKREDGNYVYAIEIIVDEDIKLTIEGVDSHSSEEWCKTLAREMISEATTDLKLDGKATYNYH